MDKDPKHDYISVLPEQGKDALLLFLMACCIEGEGDNVGLDPTMHKDGDPLFYGPDFKPYAFYHEGLYLDVSFLRPSHIADIFDKFKPFFGNYMGPDVAQDDDDDDNNVTSERYTFRLTDHLDKLTDTITYLMDKGIDDTLSRPCSFNQ